MNDNKSFDYASFISANAESGKSGFDYLHTVYKSHGLAADFILWFARLFLPNLKIVDNLPFISELFDAKRYQELLNAGCSSTQAQFWMNLLEITGLFDDMSTDQAVVMAELLVDSWNLQLNKGLDNASTLARAVCDEETGEVFVTIGTPD